MSKRLIAVILILLLPTGALADDSAQNPIQSNNSAASQLGPSTSSGQSDSSTSSSGVLQPAGMDPLQSTNGASGQGSSAASTLQDPGTASQNLQVLSDNADGSPHTPSSISLWGWIVLIVGLFAVTGSTTFLLFRSNQTVSEEEAILVTESMDETPIEAAPESEDIVEEDQPEAEATDVSAVPADTAESEKTESDEAAE